MTQPFLRAHTQALEHNSANILGLQYSQLSLRASKLIFKIKYNDDTKRIPQEKNLSFADIIRKCEKSFSLEPGKVYGLKGEEGPGGKDIWIKN